MFDPELLREFVAEASEQLEVAEREILACEQGRSSPDQINRLFRALHTIKGGAGLVGAGAMTRLAHALENVIGRLRSQDLDLSAGVIEALLGGLDRLKTLLAELIATGVTPTTAQEPSIDREVAALDRLLIPTPILPAPTISKTRETRIEKTPTKPTERPTKGETEDPLLAVFLTEVEDHLSSIDAGMIPLRQGRTTLAERQPIMRALHRIRGAAAFLHLETVSSLAAALGSAIERMPEDLPPTPWLQTLGDATTRLRELLHAEDKELVAIDDVVSALARLGQKPTAAPNTRQPPRGKLEASAHPVPKAITTEPTKQESVRISVHLLDKLMDLAAELVLVRNQNVQAAADRDIEQLLAISQRLNVVTSELQATAMRTRMRAIGGVFSKFHRTVRDMGHALNKEVELEVRGEEVELDKGIIDAIGDPLTHIVRNAVAHGIEEPEARLAQGKRRQGRVILSAFHRHGQVNITVEDDGAGMDTKALIAAAVRKGLLQEDAAANLSEREVQDLVFLPGLTTAKGITDIAGRGVGMDIVRQALEGVGGTVEITSRRGEGTRFTVKLPLTLAIIPALIVSVGTSCFAIPQQNIDEVVWLHSSNVYQELKLVDGQEVHSLRGKLLPILRLGRILKIPAIYWTADDPLPRPDQRLGSPNRRDTREPNEDFSTELRGDHPERRVSPENNAYIVVLRVGEDHFGLLVDRVVDTKEIVVKGLHDRLKVARAYSGTTILGDSRIAMILDVGILANLGGLRLDETHQQPAVVRSSGAERQTVLLFDIGGEETFALPLRLVNRVEEVPRDRLRHAGGREHIDFRGGVLSLLRLESVLESITATYPEDRCYVIIPKAERPIGIVAAQIRDTTRIAASIDVYNITQPGIIGSALIEDRLTLFINLFELLERARPKAPTAAGRRILLAEDSAFYASLLVSQLRTAGFSVTLVPNGRVALDALATEAFDLLISDLEMPEMGGLELATAVRKQAHLRSLRLMAISSLSAPATEERALAAGFDAFVSKLEQDQLLERLLQWLS